ncbi:MAG: NADH:flavin oxidoreductase/NADH oxidase [Azospirillaceae bacterium]|nr:NADH:flavin oxidoreductase/NADH oxidase [Azospirillaceae bacterium]
MSLLFSPFTFGPITIPNRVVVAPMCQYSANDGCASDWHLAHLMQLGTSGAGLVVVEATAVERRGRISHGDLGLYSDDNEAALGRVLGAARRVAGPTTRFGIQIGHAGRKASTQAPWDGGGPLKGHEDPWPVVAPSALPFDDHYPVPATLDAAGLEHIVAAFAETARRAARIGFDVVEVHAAHGYLLHQFLSPLSNHRDDAFGGTADNRRRFPLQVLQAVRTALPATVALGIRISATDWVDGGLTVADSAAFVAAAREAGADYVCVSSGGLVPHVRIPTAPGYQVPFAAEIRATTGMATRAVGLIAAADQAEAILTAGHADMIALARAFLDDPRWAWHAADRLGATLERAPQYQRAAAALWPGAKLSRPQDFV